MFKNIGIGIGIVLYGAYPKVLTDSVELMRRLRQVALDETFDVAEIAFVEDRSIWHEIRSVCEQSGLRLCVSAGPSVVRNGWSLCSLDSGTRGKALEGMHTMIDYAYAVGAPAVVFMTGRDPGVNDRAQATGILLESVKELSRYAYSKATDCVVSLVLEPADREIQHKQLLGPSKEVAAAMEALAKSCPNVSTVLDMSHIPQVGETMEEATETLRGFVSHAHLANAILSNSKNPRYGDGHPIFGVDEGVYGDRDISKFVDLLFLNCFERTSSFPFGKPILSLEVKPDSDEDPDLVLVHTKRSLSRALAAGR